MKADRAPYLTKPSDSKNFHIRDGKILKSTRTSDRGQATAALIAYVAALPKEPVPGAPVANTLGAILAAWGDMLRERNLETYDRKWGYLISRISGQHGHVPLQEINRNWGRKFEQARYHDGVQGPTVRQDLNSIAAAWKFAQDEGLTDRDPPRFDLPEQSERREAWLKRDEADRLIECAPHPHVGLFIEMGLATGGRHAALLQLPWSGVRLDRGTIDLRKGMSQRHRAARQRAQEKADQGEVVIRAFRDRRKRRAHVPVDEDLIEKLKAARERAVTDNVIEFRGKPLQTIRVGFAAAVRKAGLNPEEITPHALRHSVATWLAQDGVDFWEIAGFLGHTDVRMVIEVYGHHHPEFMKAAKEALAARKKGTPRR